METERFIWDYSRKVVKAAEQRGFIAHYIYDTEKGIFAVMCKQRKRNEEPENWVLERITSNGEFMPREDQPEELWSWSGDDSSKATHKLFKYARSI